MWRVTSRGVGDLTGIKATSYFKGRKPALRYLRKIQNSKCEHKIDYVKDSYFNKDSDRSHN